MAAEIKAEITVLVHMPRSYYFQKLKKKSKLKRANDQSPTYGWKKMTQMFFIAHTVYFYTLYCFQLFFSHHLFYIGIVLLVS